MNQKDLRNLEESFAALSWCYVQSALRVPAVRHVYQEQDFAAVFIETKQSDVVSSRHALFGLYDGWKANAKVKEVFDGIFKLLMESAGWSSLRDDEQKCCWVDSLSMPCLQPHEDVVERVDVADGEQQATGFKPSVGALSAKPLCFFPAGVDSDFLNMARAMSAPTLSVPGKRFDSRFTELLEWVDAMAKSNDTDVTTLNKERLILNTSMMMSLAYVYAQPLTDNPQADSDVFNSSTHSTMHNILMKRVVELGKSCMFRASLRPLVRKLGDGKGLSVSAQGMFASYVVEAPAQDGGSAVPQTVVPAG